MVDSCVAANDKLTCWWTMTKFEKDASESSGVDISEYPAGSLLRQLSVGSWMAIFGALGAIFLAGYKAPEFLGQTVASSNVRTLEQRILGLESENKSLQADKASVLERLSKAITDGKELSTQNSSLNEKIETLEKNLLAETRMLADAKREKVQLIENFDAEKSKLSELNKRYEEAVYNYNNKKTELMQCTEQYAELEGEKISVQQKLGNLSENHDTLREKCNADLLILADLRENLEVVRSEKSDAQQRLSEARRAQSSLQDQVKSFQDQNATFSKRHHAQLYTIYSGDGGWTGRRDFYASCGTPINEAYGQAQCSAQNMNLWALKFTGTHSGGRCGHTWFALLCQAK